MISTVEKWIGLPRDERTKDWMLFQSPTAFMLLIVSYVYIVKFWGPRFMRDRKPFQIKPILQVYNVFQILANAYYALRMYNLTFVQLGYSPLCQGIQYSRDETTMELFNVFHQYFFVRLADFMDTFFFVLTKKFSHITFLHVYHHTMVMCNGWLWMQFGADGQTVFGVLMNMGIHVIMYTYYFLAACGPSVQKYLWWKKYLTTMQIVQFVIGILHALIPLFVDCGYPRQLLVLGIPQGCFILVLFLKFYVDSYVKNKSRDYAELGRQCYAQNSLTTSNGHSSKTN